MDTADGPYFTNCPSDELVELTLPSDKNYTTLGLTLTAFDQQGIPANVTPGTSQPYYWRGPFPEGIQRVGYIARDKQGFATKCQFAIYVFDDEPPIFHNCPSDLTFSTSRDRTAVYWIPPSCIDNVKVTLCDSDLDPGVILITGQTREVMYTTTDPAGNMAYCSFTVKLEKEACPVLPSPIGGKWSCDENKDGHRQCHLRCNPDTHRANPKYKLLATSGVTCLGQVWSHIAEGYREKACLKVNKGYRMKAGFKMKVRSEEACKPNNQKFLRKFQAIILRYLRARKLCQTEDASQCQPNIKLKLNCDNDRRKRDRRSVQSKFIEKNGKYGDHDKKSNHGNSNLGNNKYGNLDENSNQVNSNLGNNKYGDPNENGNHGNSNLGNNKYGNHDENGNQGDSNLGNSNIEQIIPETSKDKYDNTDYEQDVNFDSENLIQYKGDANLNIVSEFENEPKNRLRRAAPDSEDSSGGIEDVPTNNGSHGNLPSNPDEGSTAEVSVTIEVVNVNGSTDLLTLEDLLEETSKALETMVNSSSTIKTNDTEFSTIPGSFVEEGFDWSCLPGHIKLDQFCAACPKGSFHDILLDECIDCNPGSYQDDIGQTMCKNCTAGGISKAGATHEQQCISPAENVPVRSEIELLLILAVGIAIGAAIFLLLGGIIICMHRRRERRKKRKNVETGSCEEMRQLKIERTDTETDRGSSIYATYRKDDSKEEPDLLRDKPLLAWRLSDGSDCEGECSYNVPHTPALSQEHAKETKKRWSTSTFRPKSPKPKKDGTSGSKSEPNLPRTNLETDDTLVT